MKMTLNANSGRHIVWLDVTTAETIIQTMVILYNFNKGFTSLCDTFEFCIWWVQLSGLVSEGSVFFPWRGSWQAFVHVHIDVLATALLSRSRSVWDFPWQTVNRVCCVSDNRGLAVNSCSQFLPDANVALLSSWGEGGGIHVWQVSCC